MDFYTEGKVSRTSPGVFAYINVFRSKRFVFPLYALIPFLIGITSVMLRFLRSHAWEWEFFTRDFVIFFTLLTAGSLCTWMFKKKAKFLNMSFSFLINEYVCIFFGASYLAAHFLLIFYNNLALIEVFFLLGAIIAYVLSFMMIFSFTTVGPPWHFFLPTVQPAVGIFLYAFFSNQATPDFFIRAVIFFCICAAIFAIPYSLSMFSVSNVYGRHLGTGGYKFIRAFILSLLTENNDDEVEVFFDEIGVKRDVDVNLLAFRVPGQSNLKGLFLTPHVHFGPFKTAGSSALANHLYKAFPNIPGLTIFHTACTHGENLTRHGQIEKIKRHIEENLTHLTFSQETVPQFMRTYNAKARVIGTMFGKAPFVITTRHPLPSDDIEPALMLKVKQAFADKGYQQPMFVDAHNAIVGDEILVKADSEEGQEIIQACQDFANLDFAKQTQSGRLFYGVSRDPLDEFTYQDGVGDGGLIVHVLQIRSQKTVIVHIDGNNAVPDYRSRVVNLLETKGFDRIEVTTSDTHVVARVLSPRGYNPIGVKISINSLLGKIDHLVDEAMKNLEPVEFATLTTTVPQLRVWGNQEYFEDIVIPTIQKCVSVSTLMLSAGIIIPMFFSFLLLSVFYGINPNPFE